MGGAQHLSEDWAALRTLAGHEHRNLRRARLRTPDLTAGYVNEQAVIEDFLTEVGAIDHVEIVALTDASAAAGLHDQVLLSGPTSRKGLCGTHRPGTARGRGSRHVLDR